MATSAQEIGEMISLICRGRIIQQTKVVTGDHGRHVADSFLAGEVWEEASVIEKVNGLLWARCLAPLMTLLPRVEVWQLRQSNDSNIRGAEKKLTPLSLLFCCILLCALCISS
jgi:hypothetical protein